MERESTTLDELKYDAYLIILFNSRDHAGWTSDYRFRGRGLIVNQVNLCLPLPRSRHILRAPHCIVAL